MSFPLKATIKQIYFLIIARFTLIASPTDNHTDMHN